MADAVDRLYRNALSLAPMVRASTLPLRALSLDYGADTVYTEETIDQKIISCDRRINRSTGTVDFITPDGRTVLFRTTARERGHLVFQLGTADGTLALQAANAVLRDVDAIDVNMGCPKRFSVHAGMGAALLSKPETAEDIIKTLKRNLPIPVSAKIRLLATTEETVEFSHRLEHSGLDALVVHARTLQHQSTDPANWELLRPVVDALSIPVIVNGDVYSQDDIQQCKELTGCSSVMIARGVLANPSIFRKEGMLPLYDVAREYLCKCVEYDSIIQGTKYTLMEMMCPRRHSAHKAPRKGNMDFSEFGGPTFEQVTRSKSVMELCDMFQVRERYDELRAMLQQRQAGDSELPAADVPAHVFDEAYFQRDSMSDMAIPKRTREATDNDIGEEETKEGIATAPASKLGRVR